MQQTSGACPRRRALTGTAQAYPISQPRKPWLCHGEPHVSCRPRSRCPSPWPVLPALVVPVADAALQRLERTSQPTRSLAGSGDWLPRRALARRLLRAAAGRPYLDLDHLKLRNDRFGRGSAMPIFAPPPLSSPVPCAAARDEVFRLHTAGDEFVALLHGPIGDLEIFGQSLLGRLRRRGVTASVGLASTQTDHVPERVNLRNLAEASCREAKHRGGTAW